MKALRDAGTTSLAENQIPGSDSSKSHRSISAGTCHYLPRLEQIRSILQDPEISQEQSLRKLKAFEKGKTGGCCCQEEKLEALVGGGIDSQQAGQSWLTRLTDL